MLVLLLPLVSREVIRRMKELHGIALKDWLLLGFVVVMVTKVGTIFSRTGTMLSCNELMPLTNSFHFLYSKS